MRPRLPRGSLMFPKGESGWRRTSRVLRPGAGARGAIMIMKRGFLQNKKLLFFGISRDNSAFFHFEICFNFFPVDVQAR
jgi:hypothetical protein